MAIGVVRKANVKAEGGQYVQAVGGLGSIVQVHDDAEATAATATELLQPFSYAGANGHWVERGIGATRAYFFARMPVGDTVTTDPIIRIYGAWPVATGASLTLPENNSGVIANDGTWYYQRLDNTDNNAAGITLDLVTSGSGLKADSTYAYTDETDVIDLQDCWYFTVLCSTAANVNNGPVPIFARLIG